LTLHHHSPLDSDEGHGIVQQHLTLWNLSKQHQFCPKFDGRALNFSPTAAQKVVWTERDGDSGAGLTLHHHSLDSYEGHEMVQQHLTLWNLSKHHQFCPECAGRELNFLSTAAQKVVWIDRDRDSGAGLTLHHHSLHSYGGHEMVQQHLTLPVECFQTASVLS
jgi:hypothetical protein